MARQSEQLIACAVAIGLMSIAALVIRRRRRAAQAVLAIYKAQPASQQRPWYAEVAVTDCSARFGVQHNEVVRGLHLGSIANPPESLVRLRFDESSETWLPVAGAVLKPHIRYTLLAFAWLDGGFAPNSRALLVGVAGGSLLHFWRECVLGGGDVSVDAVEYDGAVLEAARAHLGLRESEPPRGQCTLHIEDGAVFLRRAEDEVYDLVVIDLDMGALIEAARETQLTTSSHSSNASESATSSATSSSSSVRRRRRLFEERNDPTRDMYRVLTSRGVLVINEYSEEPPSVRLESSVRLVRLLRRFFPQVLQIRTNTDHNIMLIAPVEAAKSVHPVTELAERARRACVDRGEASASLACLMEQAAALPSNRIQVYS